MRLDFQSRNKEALVLPFSSPGLRYHFLSVPSGKGLPSMTDGRHVCWGPSLRGMKTCSFWLWSWVTEWKVCGVRCVWSETGYMGDKDSCWRGPLCPFFAEEKLLFPFGNPSDYGQIFANSQKCLSDSDFRESEQSAASPKKGGPPGDLPPTATQDSFTRSRETMRWVCLYR